MYKTKTTKLISDDLNSLEKIEKKQIENICDACSKLIQQCNKKELKVADLKWQPHYSTVFKQLKSQLEWILNKDNSKTLEKLNQIPYLLILKNNIFNLLNNFYKFVIDNAILIGTRDHHLRKTFFVKVVHFQFLCHEIQAYFPGGVFSPPKVKISKVPARTWWETNFGEEVFTNLDTFVTKFNENYPFINQAEIFSFKNSINFTGTNFITTFEFDLFTRLYSPWEMIQEAWRIIYTHPAYLHFSTYGDTKDSLSRHLDRPGTYVFRVSCKDLGFWTIGYVKASKEMGQIKVDKTNLIEALVEGHKKNIYIYPNGEYTNPDLSNINQYRKEIVVKNEDLQLYDCFEDFKECKICREAEKDLQLESCGHQICHACFKMLRKYNKKNCPFCNQTILSTTKIVNIKNSSIYVDHNPAKVENKSVNDMLYVDMSSNVTVELNRSEEDDFLQKRSSTLLQVTEDSVYSNTHDNYTPIELPTRLPPGPPRPPRKSEINYPAMQNKSFDISSSRPSSETFHLTKDVSPSSPLYALMTSGFENSIRSKTDDDMYCDINDNVENKEQNVHTLSSVSYTDALCKDDICSTTLDEDCNGNETSISQKYHDIYCSPLSTIIDDDFYALPNEGRAEINDVNTKYVKVTMIYCNPSATDDDDIYALPKEEHTGITNADSKSIEEILNTSKDIYCNPSATDDDDIYALPNVKTTGITNVDLQSVEDTSQDIYLNPLDKRHSEVNIRLDAKDDTVIKDLTMGSNEGVGNTYRDSNTMYEVGIDADREYLVVNDENGIVDDDIYSNIVDESDNIVKLYPGLGDLFSNWNVTDVERAMRVARNDKVLALDILLEFVPTK